MNSHERVLAARDKTTLTGVDVAAIARVQPTTAYSALARGLIPGAKRKGRWYRVTHEQVLAWIASGCPAGENES